jgi:hypothetical protein
MITTMNNDSKIFQIKAPHNNYIFELMFNFNIIISNMSDDHDNIPKDLQPLKSSITTILISTAGCERSFSLTNIMISAIRNTLLLNTTSSFMSISLVGLPTDGFNVEEYVKLWLGKGCRDAECKACSAPVTKQFLDSMV